MRRVLIYLYSVALLLALWGCPQGSPAVEWGGVVYAPHSATGFEIVATDGASTVLRVLSPWQGAEGVVKEIFISRNGEQAPEGFGGVSVKAAPERVVCMSSSHIAFVDALGKVESIRGVSGAEYISNHHIAEGLTAGKVREVGYDSNINFEVVASLRPDMVFIYGTSGENGAITSKLTELGIPYVYIADHAENSPLGKSEWVVALGELYDMRDEAESVFGEIAERYESLRLRMLDCDSRPKVMLNSPYKDVWFVPADESYVVRLIEDAGGEWICGGSASKISRPISGESAFVYLSGADFWLHPNAARTTAQLVGENPKFATTKVVKQGNVYNCTARNTAAGGSDFWESGALRADLVLADMIAILHPEVAEGHTLYYYEQLR